MGGYVNNSTYWSLRSNKDFSEKNLSSWEEQIDALDRIQIDASDFKEIAKENLSILYKRIFLKRKNLHFRIYCGTILDISFLSEFTELESLSIEVSSKIENIKVLENLKNLKELYLTFDEQGDLDFLNCVNINLKKLSIFSHRKKKVNLDLTTISRFKALTSLRLQEYNKNIETLVPQLSKLEHLALRSISKPTNLDFITKLKNLKDLTIQLGSFDNLNALSQMKSIRYLQLWRLSKLTDIDFVSEMDELQFMYIETLNGITKFPAIKKLNQLRRIQITSCKNLTDFSEIEKSKSLTDFTIQNATNKNITDFIPVLNNPTITDLGIGYQKASTQKEVESMAKKYNKIPKTYMYAQLKQPFEFK